MSAGGQGAERGADIGADAGARRAAVVGAGIVGLSVAWFLQEHGYEVTVYDSRGVAAGASAGNAGWICPGMTAPLPEPGVLSYALRSLAEFDVAVLANGAWLRRLGRPAGVRVPIAAGRGYSCTVKSAATIDGPLYLPSLRVACTPATDGMRMAGTMEFRAPDSPVDRHRIEAIIRSAKDYLDGVDWASASDLWVGPRPVTADGLPLIGATRHAGIYVAGGHGMWGMTLRPAAGRVHRDRDIASRTAAFLIPADEPVPALKVS